MAIDVACMKKVKFGKISQQYKKSCFKKLNCTLRAVTPPKISEAEHTCKVWWKFGQLFSTGLFDQGIEDF